VIAPGIVGRRVQSLETAGDHGFPVVGFAHDQQVGHTIHARVAEQVLQFIEDAFGSCVADPMWLPHSLNSLVYG
jgi:hypothetical protein